MTTARATAQTWDCSIEEYHADHSRVGHSMLDVFISSPARYEAMFVKGTLQREETEGLRIGNLLHVPVLEPERWLTDYLVAPECDRRTKVGKATWAEFCEKAQGRTVVRQQDYALADDLAQAIRTSELARPWLDAVGANEKSVAWTDPATDLDLKARFDRLIRWEDQAVIVDLKTTVTEASPAAFGRRCVNYGYHRQAAHYLDGLEALTGRPGRLLFIVVSKKPPHEVAVYELDERAIALGRDQNAEALERLAECLGGARPWQAVYTRESHVIALPNWAFYDDFAATEAE